MSGRTYRVTGITLKGIPLGESDRVVTILTREQGLVRAVAKGSRKPSSKWGGRLEPFVINDLLLVRGGGQLKPMPPSVCSALSRQKPCRVFPVWAAAWPTSQPPSTWQRWLCYWPCQIRLRKSCLCFW
jgi:hypothetical protein